MRFVASTRGDPEGLLAGMRHAVQALDPELPVYQLETMQQALARSLAPRRVVVTALVLFGVIALVLSVSGVYAVVSYVVGRRRHELGIRMALGARRGQVLRLVLGHGLRLVLLGLIERAVHPQLCFDLVIAGQRDAAPDPQLPQRLALGEREVVDAVLRHDARGRGRDKLPGIPRTFSALRHDALRS